MPSSKTLVGLTEMVTSGTKLAALGVGGNAWYVLVLRGPPLPLGMRWMEWQVASAAAVFVHLRLAGIEQRQQAGIVGIPVS